MAYSTNELNEFSMAFLLAKMMKESSDPGEFRRQFVKDMTAAYGNDHKDMSKENIEKSNAIFALYGKADEIYHKIK